jgi:hypothetical protein
MFVYNYCHAEKPMRGTYFGILLYLLPTGVAAQDMANGADAPCAAVAAPATDQSVTAATAKTGLGRAALALDATVAVALAATPDVQYPLRPEKPGGSVSHGGLLDLTVKVAGTYRVAISAGAWIDLVRGGKAVASSSHGPGPACSALRKTVEFPLTPGHYTLQIAGNGSDSLLVRVTKAP